MLNTKLFAALFLSLPLFIISCQSEVKTNNAKNIQECRTEIAKLLDSFHLAAAHADYTSYFNLLTSDATFLGTDATEHWTKDSFAIWAKPYFDKGKAWSFRSVERHIYVDSTGSWAWFDELLSTQMKLCRGSGVVVLKDSQWKIRQYVLSMTIPNVHSKEVTTLKTPQEDSVLENLMH